MDRQITDLTKTHSQLTSNLLLPTCYWSLLQTVINWWVETGIICVWRSSQLQGSLSGQLYLERVRLSCRAALQTDNQLIKVLSMNMRALWRELSTCEFYHLKATSWDKQGDTCGSDLTGTNVFPTVCNCKGPVRQLQCDTFPLNRQQDESHSTAFLYWCNWSIFFIFDLTERNLKLNLRWLFSYLW